MKLLLIGLLTLVACTPTSRALVDQAVETVKASEDAKARLAVQAPCAMTATQGLCQRGWSLAAAGTMARFFARA